jgi:hypothetical protein
MKKNIIFICGLLLSCCCFAFNPASVSAAEAAEPEPFEYFIETFGDGTKAEVIITSPNEVSVSYIKADGSSQELYFSKPWRTMEMFEDMGIVTNPRSNEQYLVFCAEYSLGMGEYPDRPFPYATVYKKDELGGFVYDDETTKNAAGYHLCTVGDIDAFIGSDTIDCSYFYDRDNVIDKYFELAGKELPPNTFDLESKAMTAWKNEMQKCYGLLKSYTVLNSSPYNKLVNEEAEFIQYVDSAAANQLFINNSDGYSGGEGSLGALAAVQQMSIQAGFYKDKTLELFNRLYSLGAEPRFVFNPEDYVIQK